MTEENLNDFIPPKQPAQRKQIAVDVETYDLLAALSEEYKLSLNATVKALVKFYIKKTA